LQAAIEINAKITTGSTQERTRVTRYTPNRFSFIEGQYTAISLREVIKIDLDSPGAAATISDNEKRGFNLDLRSDDFAFVDPRARPSLAFRIVRDESRDHD